MERMKLDSSSQRSDSRRGHESGSLSRGSGSSRLERMTGSGRLDRWRRQEMNTLVNRKPALADRCIQLMMNFYQQASPENWRIIFDHQDLLSTLQPATPYFLLALRHAYPLWGWPLDSSEIGCLADLDQFLLARGQKCPQCISLLSLLYAVKGETVYLDQIYSISVDQAQRMNVREAASFMHSRLRDQSIRPS